MTGNLLDRETSPYLLQHKDNPVHWRPWGEDAFADARRAEKPVLLSVGYAACHWCHVMAHESFEDPETAALVNAHFIPVKVDREERPDVDMLYQRALSMMGEHGGWPLTMFLTPDGEPFWGGTYFPREPLFGRPSFRHVLTELTEAYRDKADTVRQSADILRQALRERTAGTDGRSDQVTLSPALLNDGAMQLLEHIDWQDGGLQGAPKFPMPFVFAYLWRAWRRTGTSRLRDAVTTTLHHMAQGGIYDHLGGGFARYSTDGRWLVPHFEKMLYDNAQLVELMTAVWQETRDPLLADRVTGTVDWLAREMIAEDGAFAATQDADSEGEEGRFYVWTQAEVAAVLSPEDAALVGRVYDVTRGGNWETGRSVLHRNHPGARTTPEEEARLAESRARLAAVRARRVPPARDDKVLADWNGLMIAALARAGLAFRRTDWIALADTAFQAVHGLLGRSGDRLAHATRHGKAIEAAMLDDYAALARAALFLHEATGRRDLIDQAIAWAETAQALYHDDTHGGWFMTAADDPTLIARPRSVVDTAVPSGAGLMAEVCARLFWLTGEARWHDRAAEGLRAMTGEAVRQFPASATLLNAAELLTTAVQVVVVGPPEAAAPLVEAAFQAPAPTLVLQRRAPDEDLPATHPAAGKPPRDGAATAYVCHGPACSPPVTDAGALQQALAEGYSAVP